MTLWWCEKILIVDTKVVGLGDWNWTDRRGKAHFRLFKVMARFKTNQRGNISELKPLLMDKQFQTFLSINYRYELVSHNMFLSTIQN